MHGLFYLSMLIGVAWLCAWVAFPDVVRRYPSPFDMRGDTRPPAPGPEERWRRHRAKRPVPAPVDIQHAVPEPRAAKSWRVRGEQAAPPRRQRRG